MLLRKYIVRVFILLFISFCSFNMSVAQEVISPLGYNPVLAKKALNQQFIARRAVTDTFNLTSSKPFFDDFSQTSYFPKDSLWLDRNVFINSTFAHQPPSYGVATFDGLNEFGVPYRAGYLEGKGVPCDTLTSVPINLKNILPTEGLYLSFFYQAQGYGDDPESSDSLVLEFKPDKYWNGFVWDTNYWVRVWSIPGSKMKHFKQVILQVKNRFNDTGLQIANFYQGGFQFRFINYGNLSGNLDNWNVDYVYLNKGRSATDTIYKDIAVIKMPESLLNDYTSVPASHLLADHSLIRDKQYISTRNLNSVDINVRAGYLLQNMAKTDTLLYRFNSNENNPAGTSISFGVCDTIKVNFPFNKISGDTIRLRSRVSSYYLSDINKVNDMATREHEFFNYYAYDDGTAENGYGIDLGEYNTGKVAYRFRMASNVNPTDSLRAISMYFNYSKEDATGRAFYLMVWKNFRSTPVRMIEAVTPIVKDSMYNGFYTYKFEHPVGLDSLVDADRYFYIGWQQNINYLMNVGLDRNYFEFFRDSLPDRPDTNIHYFTKNKWSTSIASGALMMRPIISKYQLVGIGERPKTDQLETKIYPNPALDHLSVFTGTESKVMITISDMQGRERKREMITTSAVISLEGINPGMYIVVLTDTKSHMKYYHKLIIQK
jgi:hypothetical protein